MFRKSRGDNATAYSLPSEGTIQALQLLLYVMSFVTVILIFIYIAYERPEEKKKEKPEE